VNCSGACYEGLDESLEKSTARQQDSLTARIISDQSGKADGNVTTIGVSHGNDGTVPDRPRQWVQALWKTLFIVERIVVGTKKSGSTVVICFPCLDDNVHNELAIYCQYPALDVLDSICCPSSCDAIDPPCSTGGIVKISRDQCTRGLTGRSEVCYIDTVRDVSR
jgi:hypothetical protein